MFECRIRKDKFPKDGEMVIGKISSIKDSVVAMELLEYGNTPGLILESELSKKRFKTIAQITKVGNVEVCQVIKVDETKGFVDLSLKRVGDKEKQECKEAFSKAKLAYQIIAKASKLSEQSIKDIYETWAYSKESEYGTLFSYFSNVKNDISLLDSEPNGQYFKKIIEEQFKATSFKIRVDVDVECRKSGVIGIKEAFSKALEIDNELEMVLVKSPTYSIIKVCDDKDEAFKIINESCEVIKESIESIGGTFTIVNPAKVYGEKSKHSILDEEKVIEEDSESD